MTINRDTEQYRYLTFPSLQKIILDSGAGMGTSTLEKFHLICQSSQHNSKCLLNDY